jgi:O-antigen/teichoic acid export membrane protein
MAARAAAALHPRLVAGRLLGSATVRMSLVYATAGAVYTIANLMLARALTIPEYASVTLVLAIIGFGGIVAPMGQERVVVRHHLPATPSLLAHGLTSATTTGVLVAIASFWLYGLDLAACAILVLAIAGQGTAILASSRLQSERRFFVATLITQASSLILFTAAMLVVGVGLGGFREVITLFACGLALVSAVSWWRLFVEAEPAAPYRIDWSETLALTGISAMSALAGALDRLIVPLILDRTDLAQFGVLAALVIAPMRVLQMAVQRSLMPRLRDAPSAKARRRLMLREAAITGGLVAAVSVIVWFLAPPAVGIIVGDKYSMPADLLLAGIVSGAVRVVVGFSMAAVTALSPRDRLHLVNGSGWLTLLLAIPAAWFGAQWGGLAGLVLGIGMVWLLQAIVLALFVQHRFRGP